MGSGCFFVFSLVGFECFVVVYLMSCLLHACSWALLLLVGGGFVAFGPLC